MRIFFFGIFSLFLSVVALPQKIDSLKKALGRTPEVGKKRAQILNHLGYEYWIVNPVESIFYGQKAKAIAETLVDSTELAMAYRIIGVGYWAQGVYDQALTNLYESQKIYEAIKDRLGEANCRMNIGLVYADQGDHHRALNQYVDALELFKKIGVEDRIGTTYNKMGTAFLGLGNLTQAESYLMRGLAIHKKHNFTYGMSESHNRLGLYFAARGQYDTALAHFEESIELSKQRNDQEGLAKNYENIAAVHTALGEHRKAESYLLQGAGIAEAIGSKKWLKEIFLDLKNIYQRRGEYQKAIAYYDQYLELREGIFNEETARNISDLEAQLATVEQERLITQKQQQIEILEQQAHFEFIIRVTLGVLFVLLLVIGYLVIARQRLRMQQRQELAEARTRELDRELEMKNREITSYTVNFVQKNQLFEDLKQVMASLKRNKNLDPYVKERFKEIDRIINNQLQVDKDWEDFKVRFESLHQNFFDQLMAQNPSMTNNELRLSALIRLNLSMKEIGNILGISAESVKTARYRLKKKLNLPTEVNLNDFLNEIGNG